MDCSGNKCAIRVLISICLFCCKLISFVGLFECCAADDINIVRCATVNFVRCVATRQSVAAIVTAMRQYAVLSRVFLFNAPVNQLLSSKVFDYYVNIVVVQIFCIQL